MRVTAFACYAVAGMFVVFAVWAAFGLVFSAEPLPLALNVISKILCFVAAIMLVVWRADAEVSNRMLLPCRQGPQNGASRPLPRVPAKVR